MNQVNLWQRPTSVPIPTVWSRYESKTPMANGVKPVFIIQDFTEEWRKKVLHQMREIFLRDEPLAQSISYIDDTMACDSYIEMVENYLNRKMSLIAVVENLNQLGDPSLPELAGCNITAVVTKEEHDDLPELKKVRLIVEGLEQLKEKNNPFQYYKVSELLYALGLSVHPAYRGHNLGHEILKARFPLCRAVGITVTATTFTAVQAQKAAAKAGFETLAETFYDQHKNEKGDIIFKIDNPKSMKLMAIRIS